MAKKLAPSARTIIISRTTPAAAPRGLREQNFLIFGPRRDCLSARLSISKSAAFISPLEETIYALRSIPYIKVYLLRKSDTRIKLYIY